jgi:pyruvate dehydrogenase E2 component (dihydrolipoyllysine-residue acetyltransferase)
MTDVIMPQMGESIAEGTVTKWMKNVGDRVERDEPLFEISTDKVDAEIPSPASGILKEIRVAPGTTVPINTVVGVIAAEGEAVASAPAASAPASAPAAPAPPAAPAAPAAPPAAHAAGPPAAAPTAAAPPRAPAPTPPSEPRPSGPAPGGSITQVFAAVPSSGVATEPQRMAAPPTAASASAPPPAPAPAPPPAKPTSDMTVEELRQTRSSPVVRKIAAEHQLDISEIPGTGIGGRVTKQDILGHIEGRSAPAAPPSAAASAPAAAPSAPAAAPAPAAPAPVAGPRVQIVPMSPIRKKTAEHMVLSKRISAHVSTVFEIDFSRIDHLRHKHKASFEERGVRLTYMPFVLKAVVDALAAYPVLNASIDGDNVVYRKDVNLGVAVALDWGLIVPVIHHADEKSVLGLARAVNDIAERARAKKLKVDEVQGGTFTVTNPGVFGSLFGTPIINQPQVAILGLGTIEKRPVVRDDAIAIRTMAYVALTFDHRLVDGSDADRFMAQIKKTLQEFDEASL